MSFPRRKKAENSEETRGRGVRGESKQHVAGVQIERDDAISSTERDTLVRVGAGLEYGETDAVLGVASGFNAIWPALNVACDEGDIAGVLALVDQLASGGKLNSATAHMVARCVDSAKERKLSALETQSVMQRHSLIENEIPALAVKVEELPLRRQELMDEIYELENPGKRHKLDRPAKDTRKAAERPISVSPFETSIRTVEKQAEREREIGDAA